MRKRSLKEDTDGKARRGGRLRLTLKCNRATHIGVLTPYRYRRDDNELVVNGTITDNSIFCQLGCPHTSPQTGTNFIPPSLQFNALPYSRRLLQDMEWAAVSGYSATLTLYKSFTYLLTYLLMSGLLTCVL